MSTNLRPFATIAVIAASCIWACEPDLGALSSQYDPNASGTGGNGGTNQQVGGTGGVSGTNPTGGSGGTSHAGGTGGDGSLGGDSGEAGAAGAIPAEGGTGGTGATGGRGGTGGTSASGGTGGTTTPSSCTNNKRDSNESDVDCGGTSKCGACDSGLRCTTDGDCQSDFCKQGRCADPTCGDGVRNEGETGTDCGGPCQPCEDDVGCGTNDDCIGQYCKNMVCTDHCTSGLKEADETDKDCGGKDCAACGSGKRCLTEKDCASLICTNSKCTAPSCSDTVQNQGEGDVDCGAVCADDGKWCLAATHKSCNLANDCDTSVCSSGVCVQDTAAAAIQAIDVIDDFEASTNMILPTTGGRQGNWYGYDDMTMGGTHSTANELIPGHRGINSTRALHTSGNGFTNWGAGIGADLNHGSGAKTSYNASFDDGGTPTPYAGVTFWARSDTAPQSISVVFPDGDTDPSGGICVQPNCDHHYLTSVIVSSDWQRYTVLFADLMLESGTSPQPGPFDPTRLVSVQFRVNPGPAFDYWIDDVAFVRP